MSANDGNKIRNYEVGGHGTPGKMIRRAAVAVVIAKTIASCLAMAAQEKPVVSLTSDFEGSSPLERWRFSSGADSPSARGTLELGPGHSGRGAVLNYQIPCGDGTDCHGSASALWRPGPAIQVGSRTSITLWIRFAADVAVVIQCKDERGRSTEFLIPVATLEQPRVGEWRHVVIPLAEGPNRVKGRYRGVKRHGADARSGDGCTKYR